MIDLNQIEKLIHNYVNESFKETYGHLLELNSEEENQKNTSKKIEDLNLRAPEKKGKDLEEEEIEDIKTVAKKEIVPKKKDNTVKVPDKLPEVIKTSDIIKTINVIRSGNSLKEKDVLERFKQYFATLSGAEKIALKGYLDGLSQVISGGVPGTEAVDPSEPPYNIEMKTDDKKDKDNTSISSKKLKSKVPAGTAAPIIVGEIANKSKILKYLQQVNS